MKKRITFTETVKFNHEIIISGDEASSDAAINSIMETSDWESIGKIADKLKEHCTVEMVRENVFSETAGIEYKDEDDLEDLENG